MSAELATIPHKPPSVAERALAVFAAVPSEEALRDLAKKSATITEITNEDGKSQCHAARMVLKNTRLEIKRVGEEGREDAVQTSKGIIAIQNARIALLSPEEERLAKIEKAWDDRIEAEKEAKIQAEIARVAEIQRRIDGIRNWPIGAANQPSLLVGQMLAQANAFRIEPEVFEEHADAATAVLAASIAALTGILQQRKDHEAKEAQLEIDRKELVRLKAEEAERQAHARAEQARKDAEAQAERDREAARIAEANRIERQRIAEEEAAAKVIRDAEAARNAEANRIERARIAMEEADAKKLRDEETARQNAILAAERKKLADEQAETDRRNEEERQRQDRAAAMIIADREALAREQAALVEAQKPKPEPEAPPAKEYPTGSHRTIKRPTAAELVSLVADHYRVSPDMARLWLKAAKVELEQAAA